MSKKMIISHIHVWDKKNKGDLGIVLAVKEIFKEKFGNVEFLNFPIEVLKGNDKKEIKKINSSDFVVIGGGGIFYNYFMPFNKEMIGAIKVPIVIFGAGYIREVGAKTLSKNDIESIIFLSKKASLVGVRDYYTEKFLIKNGLNQKKIKVIGDPAIFLKETKTDKIGAKNKIKIGLNLNYSGWLGFGPWKNEIINAYKEVIDYFEKKHGFDFYYLVHHLGEYNILNELGIKKNKIVDLDPKKQKYIYGQLDLVIGMMLHSCVMAFGAGTPEINVAYDLRNRSFAHFIGHPELVVDLKDLKSGKLLKVVKKLLENKNFYQKKFIQKRNKIKQKQEYFLEEISKLKKYDKKK